MAKFKIKAKPKEPQKVAENKPIKADGRAGSTPIPIKVDIKKA